MTIDAAEIIAWADLIADVVRRIGTEAERHALYDLSDEMRNRAIQSPENEKAAT